MDISSAHRKAHAAEAISTLTLWRARPTITRQETPITPVAQAQLFRPVYDKYFADPAAFRHGEMWYAVGTGPGESIGATEHEKRVIPFLRSRDFKNWEFASFGLVKPDTALGTDFWAPECAFDGCRFYLYYSVGFGDKNHQLRVAVSDEPTGPYRDAAGPLQNLASCPFAIDPHPFQDEDGQWYLFYARDFLDCSGQTRAGTALVVDRMIDMTRLERRERTVARASCEWQRFMKDRTMYGKVWDWHTLEGPFVRKHEGKYYCLYSGGRWDSDTYGVDYAVADHPLGPWDARGSENGPRVMHTLREHLLGPGHNSVVSGPDGADYIVYHAWDANWTARRMHINRLIWTKDGPRCEGFESRK